jgi:hypothetical protein
MWLLALGPGNDGSISLVLYCTTHDFHAGEIGYRTLYIVFFNQ